MKYLKLFENFDQLPKEVAWIVNALRHLGISVIQKEKKQSSIADYCFNFSIGTKDFQIIFYSSIENKLLSKIVDVNLKQVLDGNLDIANLINIISKAIYVDYSSLSAPQETLLFYWKKLITADPAYTIECPAEILKHINIKILKIRDYGILDESLEYLDDEIAMCYYLIKECSEFENIQVFAKYGTYCIRFEKAGKFGEIEVYRNHKNAIVWKFTPSNDLKEFFEFNDFVDYLTRYIMSNQGKSHLFEKFWKMIINKNSSFITKCPVDLLSKFKPKLGKMGNLGILEKSNNRVLNINELCVGLDFYDEKSATNWEIFHILNINDLKKYDSWTRFIIMFDLVIEDNDNDNYVTNYENYQYMIKSNNYNDKIIFILREINYHDNWCFAIYGYDKFVNNTKMFIHYEETKNHLFQIFEKDVISKWKLSNKLSNVNKKTGIFEKFKNLNKVEEFYEILQKLDKYFYVTKQILDDTPHTDNFRILATAKIKKFCLMMQPSEFFDAARIVIGDSEEYVIKHSNDIQFQHDVNDVTDLLFLIAQKMKIFSADLWENLIENDGSYATKCPIDILKDIKPKLGKIASFGIFEKMSNNLLNDLKQVIQCSNYFRLIESKNDSFTFISLKPSKYSKEKTSTCTAISNNEVVLVYENIKPWKISNIEEFIINIVRFDTDNEYTIGDKYDHAYYNHKLDFKMKSIWNSLLRKNISYITLCPYANIVAKYSSKISNIKNYGILD